MISLRMWKETLILVALVLTSPVIECKRKKGDSAISKECRRTNSKAYRYCTKSCSSNKDCKENQKCLCDGDCGKSCVRNNLRCESPPKGNNLKLDISNGRFFGSEITYSCNSPYSLRGSAKRTCRAIGEWDGKKAKCRIICEDPGEIENGNRRHDGFQAGRTVHYWCFDNYNMEGSVRITCLDSGKWSGRKPVCKLPTCPPPVIPDTVSVIAPKRMRKRFRYSDRVYLKCKDGYFKSGIGAMQCKAGGKWAGGITCSPKSCGRPSEIPNGRIIGYLYSFKEKVRYVCDEGFQLRGPAYRQCQANEEWGGDKPVCEVVNCGPLKKPDNGDIIEQVDFTFGKRIVFECSKKGYEMKGSRVRTCQSDGTWSGDNTTCELVKCGDPGTPANGSQSVQKGFVYGGSVRFECNDGYTLMKGIPQIIYCRADKSWSGAIPRCLAPCRNPGNPYQGVRIGQDFRHDRTVRFTCPRDYVMEGVSEIKCSDGKWSRGKPSCKAPCDQATNPANGWKRGDSRHGSTVRFGCSRGYQRVGVASISCNDGTWDNQAPVCKGVCGRPRTPFRGRFNGNSFLDGDEVEFSCERNYDLFGEAKLLCVGRAWNSPIPECKARCRFMGTPDHGYYMNGARRVGDTIKHGERISYRCFRGYTLIGANTQECNNGRWTNDRPVCKAACRPPGEINHGKKIGNDYSHGKTARYECDSDYILEGKNKLTCNDGAWNFDPPKCRAPCRDPGSPAHGWKRGDSLTHNSWVQFGCDANYQLQGDRQIRCNDGSWTGSVRDCVAVCPDPGTPAHGRRSDNDFRDGRTVTFECNDNYDLFGNRTIQCNGGVWSNNKPECRGGCIFGGSPANGYTVRQNLVRGTYLKHGSDVKFDCNSSYTLIGSRVLHCDNGNWNGNVPACKASCADPGFIAHGNRTGNDFSHGQVVIYECTQSYKLEGNHQLKCENGKWDSVRPRCKASCPQLLSPSNGTIKNNDTEHGAIVNFTCVEGFRLKGWKQLECVNGNWTRIPPTCKASCKDPGPIKNGKIRGDFDYGSSITFECDVGYHLRGSSVLTCKEGKWNGSIPKCIKRCEDPGAPQNGYQINNNFDHGGVVRFLCKKRTYDLIGAREIKCNDGEWSNPTPTCEDCGRALGMENSKISKNRITSPHWRSRPQYARLNGESAWCADRQTHLQIDLGKRYKLTAIATQGRTGLDLWVKRYKIGFNVGSIRVMYSESGSQKSIDGNKDASSIVRYLFKEPFVTNVVRIYPDIGASTVCLRTELYGCDPRPDCILVGSLFWGLWSRKDNSLNYYQAFITKLNATHIDFALQFDNGLTRSYKRTDPVLIIDKIPEMKEISVNSRVIAVHNPRKTEWYRAGNVTGTSGSSAFVKFHDGQRRRVRLDELRLVKRPRFCDNDINGANDID